MATLYFNAAVDSDWDEIGNWWTSDAFTTQASALPTSSDSVVLSATCDTNSGSEPTVVNLTQDSGDLGIAVTVTGDATFNDNSSNLGTVTGDATFNDDAYNYGTVTGDATFNDNSSNSGGTVTGDATFNDNSSNLGGTVTGDATFNDDAYNYGTVTGSATFSLSAASAQIAGGFDGTYGSILFAYEKGINGSSILGVI
jgi:hypothetical protein